MEVSEYHKLADVEAQHWFYRGKRDLVHIWMDRVDPTHHSGLTLDVGVGTGIFVKELTRRGKIAFGVDLNDESLHIAGELLSGRLVGGSLVDLPFLSNTFYMVTALDILEHVDADRQAFDELVRVTRPGGFIFIHVPALKILWSDWDVSLHHKRRYTKSQLLALAKRACLQTVYCTYTNSVCLLPILLYRLLRQIFPQLKKNRLEDKIPPLWLNECLYQLYLKPATWGFESPLGGSFFAIFRK